MNNLSTIIDMIIIMSLMIVWVSVVVMTYEFYTTGKRNRFKFRFWYSIGMLNIFHLLLAVVYRHTGSQMFQDARWLAFLLIDAMLLEIFIYPLKHRQPELIIRTVYYFALIMDQVSNHPYFCLVNITILVYLTFKLEYNDIGKHFRKTFLIYYGVVLVPYMTGYTQTWSLLIGLVYSTHCALGVRKMYKAEKVDELMREQIMAEMNEQKGE